VVSGNVHMVLNYKEMKRSNYHKTRRVVTFRSAVFEIEMGDMEEVYFFTPVLTAIQCTCAGFLNRYLCF
jgi:hypothetical protein